MDVDFEAAERLIALSPKKSSIPISWVGLSQDFGNFQQVLSSLLKVWMP